MAENSAILDPVGEAGRRLTGPRRAIATLIAARRDHFTAEELLRDARERNLKLGRATIFRSLELLLDLGVVERLDLPSGEHAFVTCDQARHHHHVVCSSCGTAVDVADPGLAGVIDRIAAATGYQIEQHRLELFGTCPSCRASASRGA